MATAAYSELKIEGYDTNTGTLTTIQILSSTGTPTNYQLAYPTWQPSVSKRKDALISAGSAYMPVTDELTLNIVSTVSADDCLQKLNALIRLLDQADRWANDLPEHPVWIYYRPKGSTKAFLYNALILGNRSSDDWAKLPVTYDDVGQNYRINGVVITIDRSGLWLQTDTTDTVVGSTATPFAPSSMTLAKAPSRIASPIDLSFGSFNTAAIPQPIPASVLIISDVDDGSNSRIVQLNALNLATSVKYTSVGDAARNAVGTNVLRYTPTDTAYNNSNPAALNNINGFNYAVYASVRNNSGTTTFKVKVNAIGSGANNSALAKSTSQETLIDTSILTPRVVFLGVISRINIGNNRVYLSIQASAASGSLDIDQLIFVAIDDELASIIEMGSFHLTNEIGAGTNSLGFWANQGPLGLIAPYYDQIPTRASATIGLILDCASLNYVGDLPVLMRNKSIQWVWLCVAANGVDRWQYVDNANNPLATRITIIQRHLAYLIPE